MTERWLGELSLVFKRSEDGRSILQRNYHKGPLMVQKPFYPEKACHIYLLHPPGGVAGSDDLKVNIECKDNTHVLVTTPGATKFYKGFGSSSSFYQDFCVGDNASLEFLPAQNIYFKGTDSRVITTIRLKDSSKFIYRDVSKCGMTDDDSPFSHSRLFNRVSIYKNEKLLLTESLRIDGMQSIKSISACRGFRFMGTYICSRLCDNTLKSIRDHLLNTSMRASAGNIGDFTVVRLLCDKNEPVEKAVLDIWKMTRFEVTGFEPVIPRVWNT